MENELKYIHFPLCLIKHLFISKDQISAIDNIFDVGIFNYSKTFRVDDVSVYRQVIYCYYRKGLTDKLYHYLEDLYRNKVLSFDQDYNGFQGDEFDPYELDELIGYAKDHIAFRDMSVEFYKMDLAMKSLGLTGSIDRILGNAEKVEKAVIKHERIYGKDPSVMLKTELIFDFYRKTKSFNDIVLLAAFAAVKSIIGKKDFAGTTKKMIVSRMIGAKSEKVLEDFLKNKEIEKVYVKYLKRYWFDKLIYQLLQRGFVKSKLSLTFGVKSRMYLSCKLNYEQLTVEIADYWNNVTGNKKLKELKEKERSAKKQFFALITAP
ncbi:hypothetical protein A0256_23770 [Mucilaginibacter sp. PAMC 26640]|nr:hypothetical protein A0256_23770 [Mucilaginibacter sp. PAMC 26640]